MAGQITPHRPYPANEPDLPPPNRSLLKENLLNHNMDEAKLRRHRVFLKRGPADRPLFGSWFFGSFIQEQFPNVAAALKPGPIKPDDIPIEPYLKDVAFLWEACEKLNDDYPFAIGPFYGVPWMEAIMGCPVNFSEGTMWAEPCIRDWERFSWEPPGLDNPWAQKLLEFLEALVRHSAGRYACTLTLMRGVGDMCAAMRGTSELAMDLYDYPGNVQGLAQLCADVWIEIGKAQWALLPESDNGYVVGRGAVLRCWMPEKGIWLQDDAMMVLSPSFFRELFLPQVKRIADQFPMVAFHLHSNYSWPVEALLGADEIDVIQLSYDGGSVELENVIGEWKKIQEKKPCIAYAEVSPGQLGHIVEELAPNGLSIQTTSPTLQDGIARRDLVFKRAPVNLRPF